MRTPRAGRANDDMASGFRISNTEHNSSNSTSKTQNKAPIWDEDEKECWEGKVINPDLRVEEQLL